MVNAIDYVNRSKRVRTPVVLLRSISDNCCSSNYTDLKLMKVDMPLNKRNHITVCKKLLSLNRNNYLKPVN